MENKEGKIFGIGGAFEIAPRYFFVESCIDTLRNTGANRLYGIFVELSALTLCRKNRSVRFSDFGTLYGLINSDTPFRGVLTNLNVKTGLEVITPDETMRRFDRLKGESEFIYFGFPDTAVSVMATRIMERGRAYTAVSKHYKENQHISIDVPVVHDEVYLRMASQRDKTLAIAS